MDENIFSIYSGPVIAHVKRGKQVPAHIHFDCLYLLEADDSLPLVYREDESSGIRWVDFDQCYGEDFCRFIRPVNEKIVQKIRKLGI